MTGASGTIYGIRLLQILQNLDIQSHLIMSKYAEVTAAHETDWKIKDIKALATQCHGSEHMAACVASGSYQNIGMIIAPCSVKTLAEIATGVTTTLVSRAADVTLKEKRPLILMVRETPLHLGHLRNLVTAAEIGATIMPPVPAFYAKPATLEEMVDYTVIRALDAVGVHVPSDRRWS